MSSKATFSSNSSFLPLSEFYDQATCSTYHGHSFSLVGNTCKKYGKFYGDYQQQKTSLANYRNLYIKCDRKIYHSILSYNGENERRERERGGEREKGHFRTWTRTQCTCTNNLSNSKWDWGQIKRNLAGHTPSAITSWEYVLRSSKISPKRREKKTRTLSFTFFSLVDRSSFLFSRTHSSRDPIEEGFTMDDLGMRARCGTCKPRTTSDV